MSKGTKSLNTDRISDSENISSTLFTLSPVCKKPIEMSFSAEKISSDGGLLLLREIEARNGILQSITNCIKEDRHSGYVKHSVKSMLTQWVFQIAAGYEDANDCDTLREDMMVNTAICHCISRWTKYVFSRSIRIAHCLIPLTKYNFLFPYAKGINFLSNFGFVNNTG